MTHTASSDSRRIELSEYIAASDIALIRPRSALERQACQRRVRHGVFAQPLSGYFAQLDRWIALPDREKQLTKIHAVARKHPTWPCASVSAALLFGANVDARFTRYLHFAVDVHTSTKLRKSLPFRFHYVKDSRPQHKISRVLRMHPPHRSGLILDGVLAAKLYIPINERVGLMNGILTTSPLQTMFDCLRDLPFEYALIICDNIARNFNISSRQFQSFIRQRRHCWKVKVPRFCSRFIDKASENGGESFCRARMIRAGFETPKIQVEIQNPLRNLIRRKQSPTFQETQTIRPDFLWRIPGTSRIVKNQFTSMKARHQFQVVQRFTHVVAELDGFAKYISPDILASIGAHNAQEVIIREKDRETALALLGYKVVRFQFSEALARDGEALATKLRLAGVPEASMREKYWRERLLAKTIGERILRRFE